MVFGGEKMNGSSLSALAISAAKQEIRLADAKSHAYGLSLSEDEITELIHLRTEALKASGRVEFGGGILPKLIRAFCSSPYIDQYSYAATLGELQEAFYFFKNESEDRFSDDDLIEFMLTVFNSTAAGSTDLLCSISLDDLCRWARNAGDGNFLYEEDDLC